MDAASAGRLSSTCRRTPSELRKKWLAMPEDAEDLAILQAILGLASAFRREVIAEGVETVEHGELLLQLGCDIGATDQVRRLARGFQGREQGS